MVDGYRIVGVALNYHYGVDDDVEGWTQQLAVDRAYRGRGLGRALLQERFRRFHGVGYRQGWPLHRLAHGRARALRTRRYAGAFELHAYTKQLTDD